MAKQSKKLTRDQKELLENKGYESANCRFLEERNDRLIFLDTVKNEEFVVDKLNVPKTLVERKEDQNNVYVRGANQNLQSFEYSIFR